MNFILKLLLAIILLPFALAALAFLVYIFGGA